MRSFVESIWSSVIRTHKSKLALALVAVSLALLPASLTAQSISYAGMQSVLPVTGLGFPVGVAMDGSGNLYITDSSSPNVTEIAANGTQSAINSTLAGVGEIAADTAGNLYIADGGNSRVLRIAAGGGSQTTVGSGWVEPLGVAVDSLGNVYVADPGLGEAFQIAPGGAQTQIGASLLASPFSVAVDIYNNVYITDVADNSLVEVTAGGVASVLFNNTLVYAPYGVAVDRFGNIFVSNLTEGPSYVELHGGNGSVRQIGSFAGPIGLTTDPAGHVYVADAEGGAIDVVAPGAVDLGTANLCPASSPAPCTQSATLNFNVQAADENISGVVVKVATQGGENLDFTKTSDTCTGSFTTVTTCSIGIQFKPLAPGIRLGAVDVVGVVADCGCDSTRPHHTSPTLKPHSGSTHGHDFSFPPGATELATVDLHGIGSGPLAGFDTGVINTLPITLGNPAYIGGVTADTAGDIFVTDVTNCVIDEYTAAGVSSVVAGSGSCGAPAGDGGLATAATFQTIWRVALDARGDLYITDWEACVIREVDGLTGIINTIAGITDSCGYTADGTAANVATLGEPLALAVDQAGNLYVADYQNENLVRRIDVSSGLLTTVAGNYLSGSGYSGDGGLATSAQLYAPDGLAFDGSGNLYIADDGNNVIRKVTASTGIITTVAGQGPPATYGYAGDGGPATSALLNDPEGLTVDAAGNIYIADSSNLLVRKVDASTGIITTAAGVYDGECCDGTESYTGDGGAATFAGLSYLEDVTVDGSGNFYIADSDNYVVRKVAIASGVATFGSFPEGSSSPAINVTLVNDGNASLNLSDLVASSNFNLGGGETSCSATSQLTAGDSCILGIEFHPLAVGTINGTVTLTDNVGNNNASTQIVTTKGVGLAVTASKLALSTIPSTVALGGNLGTIEVSVESSNGSVVTTSSASITVTITGPGGYTHTVTIAAVNGVATFNLTAVTFSTAGAYTVTATSNSLTAAASGFTVLAANAAAKLALSALPTALAAGGNLGTVEVSVETSSGAVVTGSTASVTLTITGPNGYSKTLTVAAVNGVASFDLTADSFSASGAYTVTATSSGLTSATHSLTVTQDFTLGSKGGVVSPTQTVTAGGSAVYDLTLAPAGSSFTAPITLSATGMPAGATYTFAPATVTPGSAAASTVLTVNTAASTAVLHRNEVMPWSLGGITVATLLLPWAGSRKRRQMWKRSGLPLLFAVLMLGIAGLTGCANGGLLGQKAQSQYTITVTGTSGSLVHSTTVMLIVR